MIVTPDVVVTPVIVEPSPVVVVPSPVALIDEEIKLKESSGLI